MQYQRRYQMSKQRGGCTRPNSDDDSALATFSTGSLEYSKVCGRATGRATGTPDGFLVVRIFLLLRVSLSLYTGKCPPSRARHVTLKSTMRHHTQSPHSGTSVSWKSLLEQSVANARFRASFIRRRVSTLSCV